MREDGVVAWGWAYLVVSSIGAVLVLNALRPPRRRVFAVPAFFAGWYTGEMPLWHIVWQVALTVLFAAEGAFGGWPGRVGLLLAVLSWAGLAFLTVTSRRARHVLAWEDHHPGPPGSDRLTHDRATLGLPRDGRHTMWRFPRLVYPLPRPNRSVEVVRNIDYAGDGLPRHRLDVLRSRGDPAGPGPVLVHIHGGAWTVGDKREQGFPLMYELVRRGWVAVSINYRLSPRATWPDHIVDCKRAVSWVRSHIAAYGGDPSFVAVTGGSAGGHLAALLALTPGDPAFQPGFDEADAAVDACVPLYGVYDMTGGKHASAVGPHVAGDDVVVDRDLMLLLERRVFKRRYEDDPTAFVDASPLYRVHAGAPPFFVLHGTHDTLVPVGEARRFVAALRGVSRAPVLYGELPFTQHAFDVLPSVRAAHAVAAIVRFLETARAGTWTPVTDEGGRPRSPTAADLRSAGALES